MLCMLMTLICLGENVNSVQGTVKIFLQISEVIGLHKTIDNSRCLRMSQSLLIMAVGGEVKHITAVSL